jgi:hypothetical protein
MPNKAHEILADALEAAARLQERGEADRIAELNDVTNRRILKVDRHYGDAIAFGLGFWDDWIAASKDKWRYCAPIAEADWPQLARKVARSVRRGRVVSDSALLEQLIPIHSRPRPYWFRGLYGRDVASRRLGA